MSMASFSSAAFTTASGLAVAGGASVEVRRESDSVLAEIFADEDGATPLANPFTADASGRFTFYASGVAGGYRVTVTKDGESYALGNVAIGTAAQRDYGSTGAEILAANSKAAAYEALENTVTPRSSDTILVDSDWGKRFVVTGDYAQTFDEAVELGDGWWVEFHVVSGVTLTLVSFGSPGEGIDGEQSIAVVGPAFVRVESDGDHLRTNGGAGLRLIKRTVYTSGSGSHVYDKRTRARRAIVVGAGGGGGGADGQGSGTSAMAMGGDAGGIVDDLEMDVPGNIGASESYAIGAGGAGGAAGANSGTDGGDTTLGTLSAGGGSGGSGHTGSAGNNFLASDQAGGVATGGDLNLPGVRADVVTITGGLRGSPGDGASSQFGGGGVPSSNGEGGDAVGYGSGGAGATSIGATTNTAGGDGTGGLIIIEEYA